MHLVSRLRRTLAMTIVLISLLAGLGVASAQADAPILTGGGGRQTPRVAKQNPGTLPSNAPNTPLPSPLPIQASTPLSRTPSTLSSKTSSPDNTESTSTKPVDKTDDQATHTVRFDSNNGSKPTQSTVRTGTLATPPQQNLQRAGFRFDGWILDGQPFDFQTPILQDTTLKAQWSKTTDWTLSPDHGPATGARLTISPPNMQEPCYASLQAADDQIVGLTGDGRIYTWTKDGTPKQVPFPAQARDGYRYLQAAAGSRWQAGLGSDQHIYTWNSRQTAPTLLDTRQDAGFTSISMNGEYLLAVDRQGQVLAFQDSQADSQNPKLIQQAATSLPGKAQAVTAVASGSRILIVDSDGEAWIWDTPNTGKAKPERIRQDPGMRIIQTQALSQGALLLDADGQAWYLAGSTTSMTPVNLPDGVKTSRVTANKDQAMITGTDGRLWAWKPGSTSARADNGNKQHVQAVKAGSMVTAISRQGGMLAWSLDAHGQPGNPVRLDTTQAPTLASASLDGQALTLSRNNSSWQADIPAHKPGPAAITIAGRQDGQPFTQSLTYTVDQPLTRDAEPRSTLTVHFDTGGGKPEPADQSFPTPNGRAKRPSPDPVREGFRFDGWFIGQVAYDFSKPMTKDLTLTAKWTPASRNTTWSISPDKGSQLGRESTTITPPDSASRGIRFSQVSGSKYDGSNHYGSLAVGSDGNAYAWGYNSSGQLGDGTTSQRNTPVKVKTPDRKTYQDLPADFTYVQVSAGGSHSLALGSDGNAYAWGNNGSGQICDGTTTTSRNAPVRVKTPDRKTYPDLPADFTYVQVSAGYDYSLAVGSDGYAYAWGDNGNGKLGNNTDYDSSVPVRVRDPTNPTDAGKGLKAAQVSAGWNHSLAVGSDGNAYAWGYNNSGQLGNNTSGYYVYSTFPVRVRDPANPTDKSKGLKAIQVSAGAYHSLAVGSDGSTYAWGYNYFGQLGNNTNSNSVFPERVRDSANPTDKSKGLKAIQVSAGAHHSLAVGSDGSTYAWGYNYFGQLGNNTKNNKSAPVPVTFPLPPVITGVRFDQTAVSGLTRGDGNSVTVLTPAHQPGTVTVSVDYTLGDAPQQPDTTLKYTYLPAGVLPKAGGEGILLALATGMTGMGGVLASRRHRREQHQLSHASLE